MHRKKFGVIFLLSACFVVFTSGALAARPVDPTLYFTPGETGDSWNYVWEAGYAGSFTVTLYGEPLPSGFEHRKYYINDDPDDIFLDCETDRRSIVIIDAAKAECIQEENGVCTDGIEGEGFDIWTGAELTASILRSEQAIPDLGIPTYDAKGNEVTYAWHLSFHRGILQSHDYTQFSSWLRLVVLDLDKSPVQQSHAAAGLDATEVPHRVVSFSDYVKDVGLVLHQEYDYSLTPAKTKRYTLDLTP